jgi:hypothetical protein
MDAMQLLADEAIVIKPQLPRCMSPSTGDLTNCGINCPGLVIGRTAGTGRHENLCRIDVYAVVTTSAAFPQQDPWAGVRSVKTPASGR